jgi:tetratricopeptide (TPR) repeat protein
LKLRQFIPVLIIAAGIGAYHNSLQGPFILDDVASILENPQIRHLWPIGDALSPSASSLMGGHPVVNFLLVVNYALGGLAVWGYHALNLTIHILATLTLFGIVRRTLLRPVLGAHFEASGEWVALAVAVLWAVHPLQTEAVTYVSERGESLMGLFYLLTLYGFIRGVESPGHGRWFVLSVVACALGMATKEVMVTAPLMVLLYDRTFVSQSFREAWSRHGRLYLGLAGTWLLLGYLMAGSRNLLDRSVGYGLGITGWTYALTECRVVVHYLWLALWPAPLVFDYGDATTDITIWHLAEATPYALILAVLVAGVLVELRRQPAMGFLGAWFFVILAPSSSVVPVAGQPMAEHRMYLPLAAVVTIAVVGAFALGKRLFNKQQGVVLGCMAGGFVAVLLAFLTIQRNRDYYSALTIWQDTVDKRPDNPRAHDSLGTVLFQAGKVQEAIGHYEQTLRIDPDYAEAHYNLGNALARTDKIGEAIAHYEQALRLKPDYAEAHYNVGVVLMGQGRLQEAIGHYEQALQSKPDYAEAHNNLGAALITEGRLPEAIGHYERSLQINPQNAEAQYNLGIALVQVGRLTEAIEHWEQALRIEPDLAEAHYNLGVALEQAGRVQEAIGHYEQALRINPDHPDAHNNLGIAFMRQGRLTEAIGHYEQALRIKPDFAEAHYNLGTALGQTGRIPEAIEHLEQALRLKPDYAKAHCYLGTALAQTGRMPEAIEHLEQALRIKPDFAEAQYNLGGALEKLGRTQEAIQHYEQALRIKPDYAGAQNALARLQPPQ